MNTIEEKAEGIVRAMVLESWNESVETIARLLRELEAARKVADAALHYFDVDTDNAEWDSKAFSALDAAVAEYRKLREDK